MNLNEFMRNCEAKITSNENNSFKQQFLIHQDYILGKISVVEC
jgi:hypothetical protein